MLDLISKSKIKQKILRLFFAQTDKEYYLSEIAQKIQGSIGNTQRELEKMSKAGILNSFKKANLRFYSLNKANPIYQQLKDIVHKTIGIETEIKGVIKKMPGVKFALIFGSYAKKGDFSAASDLDLMIIGEVEESQLSIMIKKIEKEIDREINYHLYSEKDFSQKFKKNSFLQNITKNCILLTENKSEFEKLLKKLS